MHRIGTPVVTTALTMTLATALVTALPAVGLLAGASAQSAATTTHAACAAMTTPVLRSVNARTAGTLLSTKPATIAAAIAKGFTDPRGETFRAATAAGRGLVAVHRLTNSSGNHVLLTTGREYSLARSRGYRDSGVAFWASPKAVSKAVVKNWSCTRPVYRLVRGTAHEYTANSAERAALVKADWTVQPTTFFAAPIDTTFDIAVVPDTQTEVFAKPAYGWNGSGLGTFANRWRWLAANRQKLDLRYVIQVGDLVNWGRDSTGAHDDSQYVLARSGLSILSRAQIPFTLTVGNHDTDAVCDPGSSCEQVLGDFEHESATTNLRITGQFNDFFPVAQHVSYGGEFEPGKIDNSYQRFTAGGYRFLVIALELWPRQAAIDWARRVVASHPHDNVIIDTHAYADANGNVMAHQDGYGSTTPQHLYDDLVSRYRNIIMVTSGHVGGHPATSTSRGVHGNTIINSANDFSSAKTPGAYSRANDNPTRLVTINTTTGHLTSRYYAPYSKTTWSQYASSNTVTLVPPW